MRYQYSDQLTIVLTLKDRAPFTYRWMKWMDENRCPYKILIADGGADKEIENHLKNYSNYPNLNYEYVRYPYDETIPLFFAKQHDIINRVQTDYLIMQSDNDDFFDIECFESCIDFLNKNRDYVGCGGRIYYWYYKNKKNSKNVEDLVSGENCVFFEETTPYWWNEKLEYRVLVEKFFKNPHPTSWYYIFRTSVIKELQEEIIKNKFTNFHVQEWFVYLYILLHGRVKQTNKPYVFRQSGTSSSAGVIPTSRYNLARLFAENHFQDNIPDAITSIAQVITKLYGGEYEKNKEFAHNQIISHYERIVCKRCKEEFRYFKKNSIVRKVYGRILAMFDPSAVGAKKVQHSKNTNDIFNKIEKFVSNFKVRR